MTPEQVEKVTEAMTAIGHAFQRIADALKPVIEAVLVIYDWPAEAVFLRRSARAQRMIDSAPIPDRWPQRWSPGRVPPDVHSPPRGSLGWTFTGA